MAFQYHEVVPWGRSFDEYRRMFDLTSADLSRRILGCADGPASFNAEMYKQGHRVISCDPIYCLSVKDIAQRIDVTYEDVIGQTRRNQEKFVGETIASPEHLGRIRLAAMQDFMEDFDLGKVQERYVTAQLPHLPFASSAFELALCSHFLFLYSHQLSLDFHRQAIDELCRVAGEVRIFPLLTYNAEPCPFVEPILENLPRAGYAISIERVPY